jgi:hypothetical protein
MSETPNEVVEEDTLDLYDANKGLLKRDGGPYLDEVERERDEKIRAAREGREPDLDNPPPSVGTVLVPKHYLKETDASKSHVSAAAELENEPEATITVDNTDAFAGDPDPMQADWDNDHQKVRAMEQKAAYAGAEEKVTTPDPEPVDTDYETSNDWEK